MPYKDKNEQKEAQKRHYRKNKEKFLNRNTIRRKERKEWFKTEIMTKLSCSTCSENDIACLDFHHIDRTSKEENVTKMLNDHRSKESILREIEKCVVLCSNCHRKLHYYEDKIKL